MADIYIDPTAPAGGSGTAASPYNTWVGVPVAAGNRYFQKRGTTWSGAFPSLTSGVSGNYTTIAPYANTDGSDNPSQPKPIINIGDTIMPGTVNNPKSFIRFTEVDIRASRGAVTADTPITWLGNNAEFIRCNLTTNLTALYGEKVSNIKVIGCNISCATAVGTVAMNAIVLAGSADTDNNEINGNTINVGGGGNSSSHVIKCEPVSGFKQTNLKILYNFVRTLSNSMSLIARRGISINNCVSGEVAHNNVAFMHAGFFATGLSKNVWVHHNSFNNNGAFGIHITTNTSNFLIEWNTCNQNGGNYSWMNWYGRGIELSGAGLLHSCTAHIVRFNNCSENINFGGPSDNATEGVGIGLDDAATKCLVYGNLMYRNEGNGLQTYGGSSPPADTGGHVICNNHFIDNATQASRNRRGGTRYLTDGACHLGMGGTFGTKTIIANNLFVGSYGGIHENSTCANIEEYGNVFKSMSEYAISTKGFKRVNATGGSYYDFMGVLRMSAPNSERVNFNPTLLTAAGIKMTEGAATNLVKNSQVFSTDPWFASSMRVDCGAGVAPDGSFTANKVTVFGTGDGARLSQVIDSVPSPNLTYSIYVKRGSSDTTSVRAYGIHNASLGHDVAFVLVNYATGAFTLTGDFSPHATVKVDSVGNGWLRIQLSISLGVNIGNTVIIYAGGTGGTGVVGDYFYVWGAQLEETPIAQRSAETPLSTSGWYSPQFYPATASWVGGKFTVSSSSDFGGMVLAVPTVAGQMYEIRGNMRKLSGPHGAYLAVTDSNGNDIASSGYVTGVLNTTKKIVFKAVYSTTYICCRGRLPGDVVEFSELFLRQVTMGGATSYIPTEPVFISRGSVKNVYGSDGTMRSVPANTPAYDHDINTLRYENLIPKSDSFLDSGWSSNGGTHQFAIYDDPVGGTTATRSVVTSGQGLYYRALAMVNNGIYTFSVFTKYASGVGSLLFGLETTQACVRFDPQAQNITAILGSVVASSVTKLADGWARVTVSFVADAVGNKTVIIYGTSTSSPLDIRIWGAQINSGVKALEYKSTGATPHTVEYASKGISVERSSSNLLISPSEFVNPIWSKVFAGTGTVPVITTNYTIAPDGTNTAQRIVLNRGGGATISDYSLVYQNVSSNGTSFSASVFMKSNTGNSQNVLVFGGGNTPSGRVVTVGTNWTRVELLNSGLSLVFGTRGGSGFSYSGGDQSLDISVWGAQLEAGDSVTSFIGNATPRAADVVSGQTASRAADVCNIRQNIYSPDIPKKIVDLTVGSNNVPNHQQIASSLDGDKVVDPLLSSVYAPMPNSLLLDTSWRQGIPWAAMPVKK